MKYVNILLIGLVLLFPGCTFLDVVPEGNIESIESNFEKRDQTENWFKYCHFWVSPFTTSVISNPAYMGTDEVVAGTYLRESGFNWSGLYIADGLQRTFDPFCNMWRRDVVVETDIVAPYGSDLCGDAFTNVERIEMPHQPQIGV